jgi:GMP synthase-like glutamine amidotransferase
MPPHKVVAIAKNMRFMRSPSVYYLTDRIWVVLVPIISNYDSKYETYFRIKLKSTLKKASVLRQLLVDVFNNLGKAQQNHFYPNREALMLAHYLQHVPFEGLGSIAPWLRSVGYKITRTLFFNASNLPGPGEIDLLVVMGGPMSVNDELQFPWLADEKRFIREVIEAGKSVVGVCLGAQLIASALGARVYANAHKEIGWFPVRGISANDESTFRFPPITEVFHWHGETFDLPPDAVRLAESDACFRQAFQLGRSVIGLQFHLETTAESAREIVDHCRHELVPTRYVQSEQEILAAPPDKYQQINRLMAEVLSYLTR